MDPNETLANIRTIIKDIDCAMSESEVLELADELTWLVKDLDQWITRGGFPPTEWNSAALEFNCPCGAGPERPCPDQDGKLRCQ